MRHRIHPDIQIILAALLFSTGGAAIKLANLTSWQIASFRSGLAALVLWLAIPAARGRWTWPAAVVAVPYVATMLLFVAANKLTTSMNTIFLQDTAPLYILLLSPLLLRESIRGRDVAIMSLIGVGLGMFFLGTERPQQTAPNPVLGNILAAVSAITWAGTIMGLRWLGRRSGGSGAGLTAVMIGNTLTLLGLLPLALPVRGSTPTDWVVVVFLGVFQIGLAYLFLTSGLVHASALAAAILLLIEPVANPVWAYLLHGEVPGRWAFLGAGLILAATVAKACLDARESRRAAALSS